VRRTDVYDVAVLTPACSIKLRAGRTLEQKIRDGRVELWSHGPLRGFAETWHKVPPGGRARGGGPVWVEVRKELWRRRGIEVGRLTVRGQRWWTVCVDATIESSRASPLLAAWRDVLVDHGETHSYASWLLEVAPPGRR
jgi:hypothetical protein